MRALVQARPALRLAVMSKFLLGLQTTSSSMIYVVLFVSMSCNHAAYAPPLRLSVFCRFRQCGRQSCGGGYAMTAVSWLLQYTLARH